MTPMPKPWVELSVAALFVALLGTQWFNHFDISDAQLYAVVARNMVRDDAWLTLRYVPSVLTPFFEHLPFGFWPMAVTIGYLGEWALTPVFALLCALCLLLTFQLVNALAGRAAAVVGVLLLVCTESFTLQLSTSRLDTVMLPFAVLAASLVLTRPLTPLIWAMVGVCATMAACIKGPFGVLPLTGAVVARGLLDGSFRTVMAGAVCVVIALMAPMGFLATHDDWWQGYFVTQVIGSATGDRTDGHLEWWYAFRFLAGRCWPALALVPIAVASTSRPARLLAITVGVVMVGLSMPSRKLWHHTLVVYPFIAAWGAVAISPGLTRWANRVRPTHIAGLVGALAVLITAVNLSGLWQRWLMKPACVVSTELHELASTLKPHQVVKVVSSTPDWHLISALAYEYDVAPVPSQALEGEPLATVALVRETESLPPGWEPRAHARGWVWAERRPP